MVQVCILNCHTGCTFGEQTCTTPDKGAHLNPKYSCLQSQQHFCTLKGANLNPTGCKDEGCRFALWGVHRYMGANLLLGCKIAAERVLVLWHFGGANLYLYFLVWIAWTSLPQCDLSYLNNDMLPICLLTRGKSCNVSCEKWSIRIIKTCLELSICEIKKTAPAKLICHLAWNAQTPWIGKTPRSLPHNLGKTSVTPSQEE